MDYNLVTALDELIVLHSRLAYALLQEFPEAHGVSFCPDHDPMTAFATADVPPGYADGYTDEALEERATELLSEISPRVAEIMASFPNAGISARDFMINSRRTGLDGNLKGTVRLMAAITGGLGAVFTRRTAIALGDRVFCHEPAEFHVVGVVEDPSITGTIEAAGNRGLEAGLRHMIEQGSLLNISIKEDSRVLEWLPLFPSEEEPCDFSYSTPIVRLIGKSRYRIGHLYLPSGSGMGPLDSATEYDRVNGFSNVAGSEPTGPSVPAP